MTAQDDDCTNREPQLCADLSASDDSGATLDRQLEIQQQGLPPDVAQAVASRPRNHGLLPVDETIVTSMQSVATWLSDVGVIPAPVDVSKSVATGILTSGGKQS